MSSFLVRREGKTKYFIKGKERIKDYGLEQLFKDKGRIRFSSVEDCKLFLVYCCGCGKTVEYHQEEDCRYFKCRVSDFCPFKMYIVQVKGKNKKKQGKVMYRLVGCKNHIHTIEYMKMVKDGMPMNIREKLEAELKALQDQLHYLETKSKESKSVISYNKKCLNRRIRRLQDKIGNLSSEEEIDDETTHNIKSLRSISCNEDNLNQYMKALRLYGIKVQFVYVMWYFKDHKARNKNRAGIDSKGYIKVTIPLITGGTVDCKIYARDLITAEGREEIMNKITMISDRLIDPISRITLSKKKVAATGNATENATENAIGGSRYNTRTNTRTNTRAITDCGNLGIANV